MKSRIYDEQVAVTVKDAAILLGTTPALIRKAIKNRILYSFKLSDRKTLIPLEEIERFMKICK